MNARSDVNSAREYYWYAFYNNVNASDNTIGSLNYNAHGDVNRARVFNGLISRQSLFYNNNNVTSYQKFIISKIRRSLEFC